MWRCFAYVSAVPASWEKPSRLQTILPGRNLPGWVHTSHRLRLRQFHLSRIGTYSALAQGVVGYHQKVPRTKDQYLPRSVPVGCNAVIEDNTVTLDLVIKAFAGDPESLVDRFQLAIVSGQLGFDRGFFECRHPVGEVR